ncbi:MAG: membrane dipeptidase [Gemmatimonadetes bacterium]|nr:membrane dipeptidase [Gemmatimonadota bacterium]
MKTLAEMRAGGMHGGFMSVVSDAPLIQIGANGVTVRGAFEPGEAVREYERQLALLRDLLPKGKARIVTSVTEWERAHADGLVGAWLSCEGSEVLDGDPERIDRVYADGVRSIQVVHYVPNAAGDLQTQPAAHGGLSPLGKAMVKRMNARGMVIDVAHAAFATVKDVVSLTSAPIMLSHSILKIDDARPLNVRAISPEHAKLVAQTGGVIGAWPSATNASFDEFAAQAQFQGRRDFPVEARIQRDGVSPGRERGKRTAQGDALAHLAARIVQLHPSGTVGGQPFAGAQLYRKFDGEVTVDTQCDSAGRPITPERREPELQRLRAPRLLEGEARVRRLARLPLDCRVREGRRLEQL